MHERIAKIDDVMLGWEDHGIFTCVLRLNYGGATQSAGMYTFDEYDEIKGDRRGLAFGMEWIIRLMKACGVSEWSKIKGRTVLALFDDEGSAQPVVGIKPLPTEGGETFLFKELAAEYFPTPSEA